MTEKQNFATKNDVKRLEEAIEANRKAIEANRKAIRRNSRDIKSLEKRILALEWKMEKRFTTLEEHLEKMITNFKDEILRHLNGTVRELETAREEQTIMGHQLTEHEGKLENHEKRITHLEAV